MGHLQNLSSLLPSYSGFYATKTRIVKLRSYSKLMAVFSHSFFLCLIDFFSMLNTYSSFLKHPKKQNLVYFATNELVYIFSSLKDVFKNLKFVLSSTESRKVS